MKEYDRPILESYWVLPGKLLAGEYPGHWLPDQARRRIDDLLQAGFDVFIDLTREDELAPYQPILTEQSHTFGKNTKYHRFPIGDLGIPSREQMKAILDTIDQVISAGHVVYLHCWGGIGRTGTTVGCYLVRHGMSGTQALSQLASWWLKVPKSKRFPHSPETDAQAKFIRNWHE